MYQAKQNSLSASCVQKSWHDLSEKDAGKKACVRVRVHDSLFMFDMYIYFDDNWDKRAISLFENTH